MKNILTKIYSPFLHVILDVVIMLVIVTDLATGFLDINTFLLTICLLLIIADLLFFIESEVMVRK